MTTGLTRSWEYWSMRVAKAGGVPAGRKRGKAGAKSGQYAVEAKAPVTNWASPAGSSTVLNVATPMQR